MNVIKIEDIKDLIVELNGEKVIVDKDIASLYGVETKRINEAVKNNPDKFPDTYMYKTSNKEFEYLRSKFTTTKFSKTRTNPTVFTEKGLYMIATILKSKKAVEATFVIIETFAKLKKLARNLNSISNEQTKEEQQSLVAESNVLLEEVIDIEPIRELKDDNITEVETKIELNLGFAKISRIIKSKKS